VPLDPTISHTLALKSGHFPTHPESAFSLGLIAWFSTGDKRQNRIQSGQLWPAQHSVSVNEGQPVKAQEPRVSPSVMTALTALILPGKWFLIPNSVLEESQLNMPQV
jgi:hypothetical protein